MLVSPSRGPTVNAEVYGPTMMADTNGPTFDEMSEWPVERHRTANKINKYSLQISFDIRRRLAVHPDNVWSNICRIASGRVDPCVQTLTKEQYVRPQWHPCIHDSPAVLIVYPNRYATWRNNTINSWVNYFFSWTAVRQAFVSVNFDCRRYTTHVLLRKRTACHETTVHITLELHCVSKKRQWRSML